MPSFDNQKNVNTQHRISKGEKNHKATLRKNKMNKLSCVMHSNS